MPLEFVKSTHITGIIPAANLSAANLNTTYGYTPLSSVGSAAGLTSIPAGQLTGTVADARLTSNVPLLNAATNAFTGTLTLGSGANVVSNAAGLLLASKLTGALPAIDGSALTGVTATPSFTSQTANKFLGSPFNASGVPAFRILALQDMPTFVAITNQNQTWTGSQTFTSALQVNNAITSTSVITAVQFQGDGSQLTGLTGASLTGANYFSGANTFASASNYYYGNGSQLTGVGGSITTVSTKNLESRTLASGLVRGFTRGFFHTNGKFYVPGGSTTSNQTPASDQYAVGIFDPVANSWSVGATLPIASTPRNANAIAMDENGIIWISGLVVTTASTVTGATWKYDPSTNTVTAKSTITTGNTTTDARDQGAGAAINGKFYNAGGMTLNGFVWNTIQVYDTLLDYWSNMTTTLPKALINPIAETWNLSTLLGPAFVDHSNDVLIVIGGLEYSNGTTTPATRSSSVYSVNLKTGVVTTKTPMPSGARSNMSSCVYNNKIYVYGGIASYSTLEVYDPALDTWTVLTNSNVSNGRWSSPMSVANGLLYQYSGIDSLSSLNSVFQLYNIAANKWTAFNSGGSLATPRPTNSNLGSTAMNFIGLMFCIGGQYNNKIDWYSSDDTWNGLVGVTGPISMNFIRGNPQAEVGPDGHIYIWGGATSAGVYTGTIEQMNWFTGVSVTKTSWPGANSASRLTDAATCIIGNFIYSAGGVDSVSGVSTTLRIYDTVNDVWSTGASVPLSLVNAAGCAYNNEFYVMGGLNGATYSTSCYKYNPLTNTWKQLASFATGQSFQTKACPDPVNGMIYVFGGQTTGAANATAMYQYNPTTNVWTTLSSVLPVASFLFGGVAMNNGIIYAMGSVGGVNNNLQFLPSWGKFSAPVVGIYQTNTLDTITNLSSGKSGTSIVAKQYDPLTFGVADPLTWGAYTKSFDVIN
jgi:N-acetylneuraminic acid mutarotase